jgi:glyoxylase-like metal-dependent hydrolase (beta-lactamase superfamily II)
VRTSCVRLVKIVNLPSESGLGTFLFQSDLFYLLIVGVKGYCCAWSQSVTYRHTHTHTPHSLGLLWTRDRPFAEATAWQDTTLTRNKHPCPRWYLNPQCQQASCLRPRGHQDRLTRYLLTANAKKCVYAGLGTSPRIAVRSDRFALTAGSVAIAALPVCREWGFTHFIWMHCSYY